MTKIIPLIGVLLAALSLAACDKCGDPIRASNGDTTIACKDVPLR
jgi:hypothetical protein